MLRTKLTLTVAFLLIQIPLFAQYYPNDPSAASRSVAQHATSRAVGPNYQAQKRQQEKVLSQKIYEYHQAQGQAKADLQGDIRDALIGLFDLDIRQKEAEIRQMEAQIQRLEASPDHAHAMEDIARIQRKLDDIVATVNARKTNRDKIVQLRLIELLGR